ncbi:hypothetical protein GOM49_02295 [Clostridium bovifaecis]|uniref:Uncharacterized protein n=1 Tax=Clostridium bovifaecis TaxID=2184719 RepID=A0A6I6F8Q2_9CLOT|nr:hypothetical protein GOM49_02295 [Clostridium bovifaecis]
MLIDTVVSAAFKNSLGQYDIKRISIFNITDMYKYFNCIEVNSVLSREIQLKIKCPICEEHHYYCYDITHLIKGSMVIGGCEKLGYPVFFIGNKEKVEEKINKYKEVNEKIYAMFQ